MVDGAIDGNSRQPRPHVGSGLESAELRVRLEPGVLNHVLCILGVPRQPVDDAEQIAAVPLDERTKGLSVAVSGPGDGRVVALVHLRS